MQGTASSSNNAFIEFNFVPCQNSTSKLCEYNLDETIEWLGSSRLSVMSNYESYVAGNYNDEAIIHVAKVEAKNFDIKNPNYYTMEIREYSFEDNSDFLQIVPIGEQTYHQLNYGSNSPSSYI